MKIVKTTAEILSLLNHYNKKKSIGFAPTMGALHEGHISLIERSKKDCDITVCSIFVNPTQFNSQEDFKNYPKEINADILKLQKANCDIVFIPQKSNLYSENEKAREYDFGILSSVMEGKYRIGHFNGMATIVEKFLNIIQPTKAFFGEKDLQQLQIVKELVKKEKISTEIIGISTIREFNGLAKSSRNKLLTVKQKIEASLIYECLCYCKENKNLGITKLKDYISTIFNKNNYVALEYVEFVSLKTLQPIQSWNEDNTNAICIAAYVNHVRLIDNIIL